MPKWVSRVAVLDGVLFLVSTIARTIGGAAPPFSLVVSAGYWTTVWVGLALAVYGFFPLTRGGEKELRRSVTCVLFAMIPACVGLITVLHHIGTPVG